MLNILGFFEDAAANANPNGWIMWVVLGVLLVVMVLMMILPQRKQKKQMEAMMAKLQVGAIVTTAGGVVGQVVQLDDNYIWLLTGVDETQATIQFLRQAIISITPAPGSTDAPTTEEPAKDQSEEVDEIK